MQRSLSVERPARGLPVENCKARIRPGWRDFLELPLPSAERGVRLDYFLKPTRQFRPLASVSPYDADNVVARMFVVEALCKEARQRGFSNKTSLGAMQTGE
jgi:hypothetical protein